VGKKIELESLGLIVNNESEGLRIDLSRQHFCIYKTKEDAITYCTFYQVICFCIQTKA
jgi:hypothetical protein